MQSIYFGIHYKMKAKTIRSVCWIVTMIGVGVGVIVIPNFIRARNTPARNPCINNLRHLDGAIQQWALENGKLPHDRITLADITPYLKTKPVCQEHGVYNIGPTVTNGVHCSVRSHLLPQ